MMINRGIGGQLHHPDQCPFRVWRHCTISCSSCSSDHVGKEQRIQTQIPEALYSCDNPCSGEYVEEEMEEGNAKGADHTYIDSESLVTYDCCLNTKTAQQDNNITQSIPMAGSIPPPSPG